MMLCAVQGELDTLNIWLALLVPGHYMLTLPNEYIYTLVICQLQ